MRMAGNQFGAAALTASVRLQEVPQNRVPAQKSGSKRFPVCRPPQELARAHATNGSPQQPPESRPEWKVEPHDLVGLLEHGRPEPRPVVAVDNPAAAGQYLGDAFPHLVRWSHDPAGLPVKGIELDVGNAEPLRQRARER